jgi:hypothetical protein
MFPTGPATPEHRRAPRAAAGEDRIMQRNNLILMWTLAAALVLAVAPHLWPDTPDPVAPAPATPSTANALARRQAQIAALMAGLEATFDRVADEVRVTEPEHAEKLIKALQESKQRLIRVRMDAIISLLNQDRYDDAFKEEQKIADDLRDLLKTLTQDPTDLDRDRLEMQQLEDYKRQLDALIRRERGHVAESLRAADPHAAQADLADRIQAIEDLIRQQTAVRDQNVQTRTQGPPALAKTADRQRAVRQATQDAAGKFMAPDDAPPSTQPAPPPDTQPAAATRPADPSAADQAAAEVLRGKLRASPEPGSAELSRALDAQRRAEDHLAEGKGKAAESDQNQALEELQSVLDKLKAQHDRIARLPPDFGKQMERDQDDTRSATQDLDRQMEHDAQAAQPPASGTQPAPGTPGVPGAGAAGPKRPGQDQVQQAQQQMKDSEGDLHRNDPAGAAPKQTKARQKLEEARDQIEQRLAQLRQQMQEERLDSLEARFRAILERQRKATAATATLDKVAQAGGWTRTQDLACAQQGAEEAVLAELVRGALEIIREDGTTIVLPKIVAGVHDDLTLAGKLLADHKTDRATQDVQQDIEKTLQEIIDAIQRAQKQLAQGGGDSEGSAPSQNPPLVPDSAELKLLRSAQLRVNGRTQSLDQTRAPGAALTPAQQLLIQRVAALQNEVHGLAQEMAEKRP